MIGKPLAQDKKRKYKVTITLKSGVTMQFKVYDTSEQMTKVLRMVDQTWMNGNDGYVMFSGTYIRNSEIAAYQLRQRWW